MRASGPLKVSKKKMAGKLLFLIFLKTFQTLQRLVFKLLAEKTTNMQGLVKNKENAPSLFVTKRFAIYFSHSAFGSCIL